MKCRVTVVLFLCSAITASAQSDFVLAPGLPDSTTAALRFERNVNTYLWNANAFFICSDDDQSIRLREKFFSSFIRGANTSYRDEQFFSLSYSKNVYGPFAAAAELNSFSVADNQTFGSSTAGIHSGAVGIRYRPTERFYITPMIGRRYDKQQSIADEGMNYRLYAGSDSLDTGDYQGGFTGQLNHSNLTHRKFNNHAVTAFISTEFAEGTSNRIHVRWTNNRNDFYIPADSSVIKAFGTATNIRSRNEDLFGMRDTLSYTIGSGLFTDLSVNVESRNIKNSFVYQPLTVLSSIPFNTNVRELRIEGEWKIDYRSASTLASTAFRIGERNETHQLEKIAGVDELYQTGRAQQESRLDNTAVRNSLSALVNHSFSDRDMFSFSGSVSLLQYDTPDTINTDDRDEVLYNIAVKQSRTFSDAFTASVEAEVTLAHLVYLSRDKSANNNWNRIFRLQPEFFYRPSSSFRMYNAFEISANYTVFDFESTVPSVKSYSYRQVAFLDSTSYDISGTVGIDLTSFIRVSERGELQWKDFTERPLQRIEEVTFSPQMRVTIVDRWFFAVGFRSFAQKRFKYTNNVRQFENTFLSAGPTTAITVRLSPSSLIDIRGWKEFQRQSNGAILEYSNVTMNVRYFF